MQRGRRVSGGGRVFAVGSLYFRVAVVLGGLWETDLYGETCEQRE